MLCFLVNVFFRKCIIQLLSTSKTSFSNRGPRTYLAASVRLWQNATWWWVQANLHEANWDKIREISKIRLLASVIRTREHKTKAVKRPFLVLVSDFIDSIISINEFFLLLTWFFSRRGNLLLQNIATDDTRKDNHMDRSCWMYSPEIRRILSLFNQVEQTLGGRSDLTFHY